MWTTLLIMAVAVSLEPVRVGLTVLMLNRPRPVLQLTAFLFGGFLMGVCVGVAALLVLHAAPITSSGLTVPRVQIAIGVLALAAAAVLASKAPLRRREAQLSHATTASNGPGAIAIAPAPPGAWAKVCARSRELLGNSSLWVAGVSGLGIALPSVDYLAALQLFTLRTHPRRFSLARCWDSTWWPSRSLSCRWWVIWSPRSALWRR